MGINERKEREKLHRREEILSAAEKLFFSKGIENTTMDDVAEEAELSKGTLYLYFKSKEEIHWEITQRQFKKMVCDMEKEMDPSKNAIENLLIMAKFFVGHFEEDHAAAHSILFFQASDLNALNLDMDKINETFINDSPIHMVTEYVRKGIDEGLIRDDIPVEALSSTLWAQLLGVLQIVTIKKELFELIHVSKEEIIDSHIKIVLNGIIKRNEKS
jgi:AcrR family transcriptional regulator